MIDVNWPQRNIFIPQSYLQQGSSESVFILDINQFRRDLGDLEALSDEGLSWPVTHNHNGEVLISGTIIARVVEIINSYRITFEDGPYTVQVVGGNSNISDIAEFNQVRILSNNTAGLQRVDIPVLQGDERTALFNILNCVELMKKFDMNRTKIDETAFTLTVFDDDGLTPLQVFDLKDRNAMASIEELFERVPQ